MKCQLFYLNVIFWILFKSSFAIQYVVPISYPHMKPYLSSPFQCSEKNTTERLAMLPMGFWFELFKAKFEVVCKFGQLFFIWHQHMLVSTFQCYFYVWFCIFWYIAWEVLLCLFKLQTNCYGLNLSLPWTRFISSYTVNLSLSLFFCRDY